MAKGGGSANKSFLFQETKAILNPTRLLTYLDEKIRSLGTAACPPYHLAVVIGGTSAEFALKTAKYASAHYLDDLPDGGLDEPPTASATSSSRSEVFKLTQSFGIGAQFGGKYFCHDVRVVRLPRHGASCPVAIAVSCSADRQALGKITAEGVFLEQLETDPAHYMPDAGVAPTRSPPARSSRSTSTSRWPTSSPSSRSTRSRPGSRSPARSSSPATSRTPRSRSASTPARRCRRTCATTPSTTPVRPRPPRAWRPGRSARRRPVGWTPTSSSSRPRADRW